MRIIKYDALLNRGLPLSTEIKQMKNPTVEHVRELYGDLGVDIFEGKKTPSILTKRQKSKNPIVNLINKVKDYFSKKAEFESDDTMFRAVHKYIFNEKSGLTEDIEKKFGKTGMKVLKRMEAMGYVQ